jgi:class 3 adenylate cyclase/pSer/pThr/pTyr-binding forkhead associated (FHA) protein
MILKVTINFADSPTTVYLEGTDFLIGRKASFHQPDLCLNLDLTVSPKHLQLWWKEGRWWLRKLSGAGILQVNGEEVSTPRALEPADRVRLGKCILELEEVDRIPPGHRSGNAKVQVNQKGKPAEDPDATESEASEDTPEKPKRAPIKFDLTRADAQPKISNLFELPNEISHEPDLKQLCRIALKKALDVIAAADKGIFLSFDPATNSLAMRACIPASAPALREELIMRAVGEKKGFIWHGGREQAMFAPLIWEEQIMGVISVEGADSAAKFIEDDLSYLTAISHYSAAAISNSLLKKDLHEQNQIQERLLANFSKPLRRTLIEKARAGKLTPGGVRSDVTLLLSDLRGYTATSADMSPEEVVEMLNDYYSELVGVVMDYQGTIDKFIGDAILAVFGSPEKDPHQEINAVRTAAVMQETIKYVNERRAADGKKFCDLGIGLHRGEVLHGFIGSEERLEFTVIGDAVNRAARLCDGAGSGQVLVSPELKESVADRFKFDPCDIVDKHGVEIPAFSLVR